MIKEFSIRAIATNTKARTAFSVCFFASFAVLAASTFLEHYSGVVGLIGLVLLVAAITLYTKYLSCSYYYEIVFDSEGTPLFLVNQLIGKRRTTLCRIGLFEIVKIECESSEEKKAHKTPSDVRKYNYVPTLFPDRVCRVYTVGQRERAEILIEVSDEIANLLSDYAREARELMRARRDEEYY